MSFAVHLFVSRPVIQAGTNAQYGRPNDPEVTSKDRSEIDGLFGADRLASRSDDAKLPYVCAMVKEVLRWRPTVPLVPHSAC